MTRSAPSTHVDRSGLVRRLAGLAPSPTSPAASMGARLGDWLDFNAAMTLFAALNTTRSVTAAPPAARAGALEAMVEQARATLTEAIRASTTPGARARIKWPQPAPESPVESAADYAPYHRFYLAQQREMETRIGVLRATVREALAADEPAMQHVAALDAAFDKALGQRERSLLAKVPLLLEKRFAQLRAAHPASGGLEIFAREMQGVLLAELETRLQPVAGLIETLSNKEAEQQ